MRPVQSRALVVGGGSNLWWGARDSLRDDCVTTSKPTWNLKHTNSILEYFEYICQMSSKSIRSVLSYTVSKLRQRNCRTEGILLLCAEMDSHHVDVTRRHYVTVAHGKYTTLCYTRSSKIILRILIRVLWFMCLYIIISTTLYAPWCQCTVLLRVKCSCSLYVSLIACNLRANNYDFYRKSR